MKQFMLIAVAALLTVGASAQIDIPIDPLPPTSRPYSIAIGPRVGGTLTAMTDPEQADLFDGKGIGFTGGLAMRVRLGRMSENSYGGTGLIGFGLELKYKQNCIKTLADSDLKLGYLEIPVTMQLFPFYKNAKFNGFYLETGIAFAPIASKNPKVLTLNKGTTVATFDIENLKGGDIRVPVGIGCTFRNGFDMNLRYYLGTSDLAENFKSKLSGFELTVGWLFNTGRR